MKNFPLLDIFFILICTIILILINELGYHHYIIIEIWTGFIAGKYVARYELGEKLKLLEGEITNIIPLIIICGFVLLITKLGFAYILSEFIIMFVLSAYFSGKYFENKEAKKKFKNS